MKSRQREKKEASPAAPPPATVSLAQLHRSVRVPQNSAGFLRTYLAFVGPAVLVSVGYMDPGNWSTDLQGGAQFHYSLLWIVALSSFMAIILQVCAARLGVVTGRDLAQLCAERYPRFLRIANWLGAEVAIAACDLAEALGSAVALSLLFHFPIFWSLLITAFDVVLLLSLRGLGMRMIEALIALLVATMGVCYFLEIFVLPAVRPDLLPMGQAIVAPQIGRMLVNKDMLVLAIAMIGATVMPHNLYLHSALVQSRQFQADDASIRRVIRYNTIDSAVSLAIAFLVNAAILVLAAMVFFHRPGAHTVHGRWLPFNADTDWIRAAYLTLTPLLGAAAASLLFAIALLASGQSSTITGTLAGQVVMEGFMQWRIRPWVRRLITRLAAVLPVLLIVGLHRGPTNINAMLNLSQVVLALQLPLAMIPLMVFTCSRKIMGPYVNGWFLRPVGWGCCVVITLLGIYSLPAAMQSAWATILGH